MPALSVLADTAHPVHACALHTSILYVNTIHQYVRVYINTLRATRCTPGARCSQRKLVGSALPVTRPDVASRARRGSRNARWSKRLRGSDGHGIGPLREIWCVGLCARGAALPPGRGRFKRWGFGTLDQRRQEILFHRRDGAPLLMFDRAHQPRGRDWRLQRRAGRRRSMARHIPPLGSVAAAGGPGW